MPLPCKDLRSSSLLTLNEDFQNGLSIQLPQTSSMNMPSLTSEALTFLRTEILSIDKKYPFSVVQIAVFFHGRKGLPALNCRQIEEADEDFLEIQRMIDYHLSPDPAKTLL